jgi:hypothetical protein
VPDERDEAAAPAAPPALAADERQPGWPQVLAIAVVIVAIVLAVAAVSNLVPGVGNAFASFPVLIAVLIVGTVLVVWRILRAPSAPR